MDTRAPLTDNEQQGEFVSIAAQFLLRRTLHLACVLHCRIPSTRATCARICHRPVSLRCVSHLACVLLLAFATSSCARPYFFVVSFIPHVRGSSVHHSSAAPSIWHVSGSFVSHHVHSVRAPRVLFTAFRLLSRRIVFSCAALPCVACVSEILPHTVRK